MFRGYSGKKTTRHKKGELGEKLVGVEEIIRKDFPDVAWEFPDWYNSSGDISLFFPDKIRFIEIKCKDPYYKYEQALTFENKHYVKCTTCEALYFVSTYPDKALIFKIRPKIFMPDFIQYSRWCPIEKREVHMYGMIPFEDCRADELQERPGISLEKVIVEKKIVKELNSHSSSRFDTKKLYEKHG
jgi:hypothetical protein